MIARSKPARGSRRSAPEGLTPAARRARRATLIPYLERTATLDEARKLARRDGITASVSVWLGAFSDLVAR